MTASAPILAPGQARDLLSRLPAPTADSLYALRLWHATECLHARALAMNPARSPTVLAKHAARADNHERSIQALTYLEAALRAGATLSLPAFAPGASDPRMTEADVIAWWNEGVSGTDPPVLPQGPEPVRDIRPLPTPADDDLSA